MTIAEANEPFTEGVANLIRDKGLKQIYVAEKAGIGKQEFSDMLNGRRLIKVCDIPKIAIALNVTFDDIYAAGKKGGREVCSIQ